MSENQKSAFQSCGIERGLEIVAEMSDLEKHREDGFDAYLGSHPELGSIVVFLPPFGNAAIVSITSK